MSDKLVVTMEQRRGGANVLKLAGVLGEDHDLDLFVERVAGRKTLINLAGVERVSSTGTREWVNWLASLASRGVQPELVACSPAFVAQLNRVKELAGHGIVKSILVPYHCETCERTKDLLVNVSELGGRPRAPRCRCEGCGDVMTFVDASGDYFAFVAELKTRGTDSIPSLARGSASSVYTPTPLPAPAPATPTPVRLSDTRLPMRASATYLSAAAVARTRPSNTRLSTPRVMLERPSQRPLAPAPVSAARERTILLAILGALVLILGALIFLLMS